MIVDSGSFTDLIATDIPLPAALESSLSKIPFFTVLCFSTLDTFTPQSET